MKKYVLLLMIAIFPFVFASAATSPQVVSLETTVEGSTIKYNGEMEEGSYAVVCKLFDKDDNELQDYSSAVDNHKFEGSFTVETNGDYTVRCAHFEGGIVKGAEASVNDIPTSTNAKTGDAIMIYVAILAISLIGAGIGAFYLVKKSK
jgi:hypothetical protein